jgi:hypothetical protein
VSTVASMLLSWSSNSYGRNAFPRLSYPCGCLLSCENPSRSSPLSPRKFPPLSLLSLDEEASSPRSDIDELYLTRESTSVGNGLSHTILKFWRM